SDPRIDRVVARLEGQHQDRRPPVTRSGIVSFLRVEDTAVRGVEAGLGDRSDGAGSREEVRELHRAPGAEARPVLQPHPRLGDHAENAFPPNVEYSKLCGKCRRVRAWGLSCASSAGPKIPASMRAAREVRSTSTTRSR